MEQKTATERVENLNKSLRPAGYEIRSESGHAVVMELAGRFKETLGIYDLKTGRRLANAGSEGDILWFLAEHCGFGRSGMEPSVLCVCNCVGCPDCERMDPAARKLVMLKLYRAIRVGFPNDTVDISDGYCDNIHIVVTSRQLDDMPDSHRQDMLDGLIDKSDLDDDEKSLISLTMMFSVKEILEMFGDVEAFRSSARSRSRAGHQKKRK